MSAIKDILSIKLDEDIKSVIDLNSQSEKEIKEELDGFILTESLASHLSDVCDLFQSNTKQSGLWLSGFYGSGKSYFAKMIGFLLRNPSIMGTPMRERFVQKLIGLPNKSFLENQVNSLDKVKSHVILFDSAKQNGNHGISYMMMAAFLRSLNFLDDWIGFWEYDLFINGQYDEFLIHVKENCGEDWVDIRKSMQKILPAFKTAIIALGLEEEYYTDTKKRIQTRIAEYDAMKLTQDLERYLDKYSSERLVFFVDEVSEAITQKKINILDLEGMSESLADKSQRIWTIAIAQQKLDDVITSTGLNKNLLTKLIDRFKNRINIEADEVDTIIRRRLLAKNETGTKLLEEYFEKNSGMICDLTDLKAPGLKQTKSAQTYSDYYPFFEHQFKMLQYFLFGNRTLVQTQVGTRGMIISAFDTLKKEAVKDRDIYTHVDAAQLCRQAEENISESLSNRYDQAEKLIEDSHLMKINGKSLLQTIHFLTKAEVIKTTVDNIAKSYISRPDDFYQVKEEVKQALELLVDRNILILSGNEYRITSETEQRIINDMNGFSVPTFRVISDIVKKLKSADIAAKAQSCNVDGLSVPFSTRMNNDDPLSTNQNNPLRIIFHDIFATQAGGTGYIDNIKDNTQSQKDTISIVPNTDNADTIMRLATELLRLQELENKSYSTEEEKQVVGSILKGKDDKVSQLNRLIHEAYSQSTLVYLYNTMQLTSENYLPTLAKAQRLMFETIYTRRLSSSLGDSLAQNILKASDTQLKNLFTSKEFEFFDSSAHFIGDQLSVTTELMAQMKSFITGADLEKNLTAPPTGYTFGTIISSTAALLRGNKIIIKFNGDDYHSYRDDGIEDIFKNTRNFSKASFKAVIKSLTYNERQDIVDILREDCNYTKWTSDKVDYKMNDFSLVDAIRSLSKAVASKVNNVICLDDKLQQLFPTSVQARGVMQQYVAAVTELNYIQTARQFLSDEGNNEYIKAIECVQKDLDFIDNGLPKIQEQLAFIQDVEEELDKSGEAKDMFAPLKDSFMTMYETGLVANAKMMTETAQKVKDFYYKLMKHVADMMAQDYLDLQVKADEFKQQLDAYPHEWNTAVYNKLSTTIKVCKSNQIKEIKLNGYSVKCSLTCNQLHDLVYLQSRLGDYQTQLDALSTEIVTVEPKPANPMPPKPAGGGGNPPTPPQPKERKMKGQMPTGKLSVSEYKSWLMGQLLQLNKFDNTDSLNFDN